MKLFLQLLICIVVAGSTAAQTTLCGTQSRYVATSRNYTFSANEWNDDGSGSQCITISADNSTFNATWQWQDSEINVHSYPNIELDSKILPLQLSNLSSLILQANWSMAPQSSAIQPVDNSGLSALDARANVVLDMFVDSSSKALEASSSSKYEVMIWIGKIGWALPLGYYGSGHRAVYQLGGAIYKLYNGTNENGQTVLSWLADDDMPGYRQDITPLLQYLWQADYLAATDYLQSCQYGTEAFHATSPVTFSTWNFDIILEPGASTVVPTETASSSSATLTSTSTSSARPDGLISGPGSMATSISISYMLNLFMLIGTSTVLFYV